MKRYTYYNRIKSVLAEKNKTGTWLSEQMRRNLGTISQWMTNKVQPSVEQLYDIAKHLCNGVIGGTKINIFYEDRTSISALRLVW